MDNDGRLKDLQKILGHKDLKTTAIYGKISNERLAHRNDLLERNSLMHQMQSGIHSTHTTELGKGIKLACQVKPV